MPSRTRVLIDATAIPEAFGGVGRFLRSLIVELSQRPDLQLVVVAKPDSEVVAGLRDSGIEIVTTSAAVRRRPLRLLWEQFVLPGIARRQRVDVIHSPHYTMPLLSRRPVVVSLHDATFFSNPEVHSRLKGLFFRTWTRVSVRRAAACMTPSLSAATEIAASTGAPTSKFVVSMHGVDTGVFHPPSADEVAAASERIGSADWVAFLGTLEPRKNVPALIRAFGELPVDVTRNGTLRLALIGAKGWDDTIDSALAASPVSERILRFGYVAPEDLAGLLGGATVVAYPSLGEGFGLPVLEAMATEAAVLTTRRLSLPEVGGDAVEYVEPDAAAIRDGLISLLSDTQRRKHLARAGRLRSQEFTWARAAEQHQAVYQRVARSPAPRT